MNTPIYFDDALPHFAAIVLQAWGEKALLENVFLRDADGRITLVVLDSHSTDIRESLGREVSEKLGVYVDGEFAVATPDELFDDRLRDISCAKPVNLQHEVFFGKILLVDRRLVGADWLEEPKAPSTAPLRLVFASIKGGVGRSTALCVLASHLASRGKRVLAVDLDLEAPGIGNMLLDADTLPEFGLLDYLVEQHVGSVDDDFFADLVASSWLGGGKGRVDVVPALGRRSLTNPANVLAKIARAYLINGATNGDTSTGFADHIETLLKQIAIPSSYDVVLIDARAGLHETTAAAVLGLGAEVLLFGIDQTQTIAGYEMLFAHLATLARHPQDDWRERLNFVHAKATLDKQSQTGYAEAIQGVAKKYLWPDALQAAAPDLVALQGEFETEWEEVYPLVEEIGPVKPIVILDAQRFQLFDPFRDRSTLEERVYLETFGEFLEKIDNIIGNETN